MDLFNVRVTYNGAKLQAEVQSNPKAVVAGLVPPIYHRRMWLLDSSTDGEVADKLDQFVKTLNQEVERELHVYSKSLFGRPAQLVIDEEQDDEDQAEELPF